jgi:hypothetical protein
MNICKKGRMVIGFRAKLNQILMNQRERGRERESTVINLQAAYKAENFLTN